MPRPRLEDFSRLLYDEAVLAEGSKVEDPVAPRGGSISFWSLSSGNRLFNRPACGALFSRLACEPCNVPRKFYFHLGADAT